MMPIALGMPECENAQAEAEAGLGRRRLLWLCVDRINFLILHRNNSNISGNYSNTAQKKCSETSSNYTIGCQKNAPKSTGGSHQKHMAAFIHNRVNEKGIKSFEAILFDGHHLLHIEREFQKTQRICHRTYIDIIFSMKAELT